VKIYVKKPIFTDVVWVSVDVVIDVEKIVPPVITAGCFAHKINVLPLGPICSIDHKGCDETQYHSVNGS